MTGTKLTDIIVPEVFNPYVINRTLENSALVQSGIISPNSEFDRLASQSAPTVNMPYFDDLAGDSEQVIEGQTLKADKIKSKNDTAAIIRRAKMWSATDLSAAMAGTDPLAAIAELVAGFWSRDMQRELLAILKGVFSSTTMSKSIFDISTLTGAAASWSGEAFIDAQQILGDRQDLLSAVVMHSETKSYLKKQNLIEVIRPSDSAEFQSYQGVRVIVDDGCPVVGNVYTTYLFGEGAIALGNGNPAGFVATETDRDKQKGSGVDFLINRKTMILHPRGVRFTGNNVAKVEGSSREELAVAANWDRVYEAKQIRIVKFIHKL